MFYKERYILNKVRNSKISRDIWRKMAKIDYCWQYLAIFEVFQAGNYGIYSS
jgi:hypothetical protein